MATKPCVVMGEAPESDSEDEINVSDGVAVTQVVGAKGRVMEGEAPESDEESATGKSKSLDSISSALSASSLNFDVEKKNAPKKEVSLLSKKLTERQVSLAKNMSDIVSQTIINANQELNTVDQHILNCQVKAQEAADILKNLVAKTNELERKISAILSNNYIPPINVPSK